MKIVTIETSGFRALEDKSWKLSDPDPQDLVVVTGPSGSGKTSLLEAIALGKELVAPYGAPPAARQMCRNESGPARIAIEWWLDEDERDLAGVDEPLQRTEGILHPTGKRDVDADPGVIDVLERYAHRPGIGKVDYFPDDRAVPLHGSIVADLVTDQRFSRLTRGPGKYASLVRYVRATMNDPEEKRAADSLRELFAKLCPRKRLVGVNGLGVPVFHTSAGRETSLDKLSGSETMAFVFAGTVVMLALHNSVVLIDDIELRLGAGDAARFIGELRAFAPTNQWIVTSSDPEVIAMVDAGARVDLGAEGAP